MNTTMKAVGWFALLFLGVMLAHARLGATEPAVAVDPAAPAIWEPPLDELADQPKADGSPSKPDPGPADLDIRLARVFPEPLIPLGGAALPGENAALQEALGRYASRKNPDDASALDDFLLAYPQSRWRAALQTNLGIARKKLGYFTEALGRLENAWDLGKSATTLEASAQANLAAGELADLNARFGRFERMRQIFEETDARDITGSPQTKLSAAKEGYWMMTRMPEAAFLCGPYAVNAVLCAGGAYAADPEVSRESSTQMGTSLAQIENLAGRVGLGLKAARRQAGAPWQVPMVVHWKVGHYAAITQRDRGRYLVEDPTFGGDIWVTQAALDSEATGYGLVTAGQDGKMPDGWVEVPHEEASSVWGKGGSETRDPSSTGNDNEKTDDQCPTMGMARYSIFKMLGTLHITDRPVGYDPPLGLSMQFEINYNHLEADQPVNFPFMNFGPYWECNLVAYADVGVGGNVSIQLRNGGSETYNYSSFNAVTKQFAPALYSGAVLTKTGASAYERRLRDGAREIYSVADGSTGRIFLSEVLDKEGNSTMFNYGAHMRLNTVTDALGQVTAISYKSDTPGAAGFYKVYRITDPFGRYAEFTYDQALTKLTKIRDVIGIESTFSYREDGFIQRLSTPYGDTDFYEYVPADDGTGRGLLVVLPDGSRECVESRKGGTMMTHYWDRKAMAMGAGDQTKAEQTHWLMTPAGNVMVDIPNWRKEPFENAVAYYYPGQPDSAAQAGFTQYTDPAQHFHCGTLRRPSKVQRKLAGGVDQVFQYEYNNTGRITKSIDPVGRTFEYRYAPNGLDLREVRQTRGGDGDLLLKASYDAQNNPVAVTDASGRTTSFAYNNQGQITNVVNPRGETNILTYSNGFLVQIDGPLSGTNDRTEFGYHTNGNLATLTIVAGPGGTNSWTQSFAYDALDRLTQTTFPDGSTEQHVYSRLDLVRSKDRLGRWTVNTYDSLGQLSSQRDPAGRMTLYEWCRCGALQGLTDPAGNVTKWAYDVQGRLFRKTYPDGSQENREYEAEISRLKNVTDRAGNQANYTYNVDDTLATVSRTEVAGFAGVATVTLSWDTDYRRLTSVGDSYATYGYSYGAYVSDFFGAAGFGRGMLAGVSNSALAGAGISYEYDEVGRVAKRQINGTTNQSLLSYDAAGRLNSWSNSLGSFTPSYVNASYGVSRLATVAFPNGQTVNYGWEANTADFRLKGIENLGATNTALSKFDYTTDASGRILQWKQQRGTAAAERYDLGYDPADQLIAAVLKTDATGTILKQFYYAYDPAGNRTSEQIDATVRSASFNNLNQLTNTSAGGKTRFQGYLNEPGKVTVAGQSAWMQGATNFTADVTLTNGTNTVTVVATDASTNSRTNTYQMVLTGTGSTNPSYDANGNMLADGSNTYAWDAANRLVKVTYGSGATSEFTYDAFGRRVKIVEKDSGGVVTSTRQFVYDGLDIAEQRDGTNAVTKRYYSEGWRDVAGGASYFYTKDHLGSIREVANSGGSLVTRYDYDPYGRVTKLSGTVDSDMLYTGHYHHAPSSLHLTLYRAYSPDLARWLSPDPIGEAGGRNLYAYVENNPLNLWDPWGLKDYTREETEDIIAEVGRHASAGGFAGAAGLALILGDLSDFYGSPGRHDYKGAGHTFCVDGDKLEGDEFSNFLAGYAGFRWAGPAGVVGAMAGGVVYDYTDPASKNPRYNPDADSRGDIAKGAVRAAKDLLP